MGISNPSIPLTDEELAKKKAKLLKRYKKITKDTGEDHLVAIRISCVQRQIFRTNCDDKDDEKKYGGVKAGQFIYISSQLTSFSPFIRNKIALCVGISHNGSGCWPKEVPWFLFQGSKYVDPFSSEALPNSSFIEAGCVIC